MNEQDKQILLKDLCARLPYEVKVHGVFLNYNKDKDKILYEGCDKKLKSEDLNRYKSLKPYLRPMSSMTEDEELEYENLLIKHWHYDCVDWLNAHHFDYRKLI